MDGGSTGYGDQYPSVIKSDLTKIEDEESPEFVGLINLLDVLDLTDSPTVPKAFLMLMSGDLIFISKFGH
jgi:hypothetical protein